MPPELTGTTENVAASVTTGVEPSVSGNVSSGTASDAMIKAAMAASSAETPPAGAAVSAEPTVPATPGTGGTPVAATGQQVPTGQPAPTGDRGPIPLDRHETIVRNTRDKAVTETEAKYAWAKDVEPKSGALAMDITGQIASDPHKFANKLANTIGMKLVPIEAAGTPEQPQGLPKARLRAEDGTEAYAADQMPAIVAAIVAQVRAEYQPLLQDRRQAQEQAAEQQVREGARQTVASALVEARKQPHFTKENEPAILAILQSIPAEVKASIGPIAALYQAYTTFLGRDIFPTIQTTAEANVRAAWDKKAAASIGAGSPTASGGDAKAPVLKDGDVGGLARHMERLASLQTA